jgi:peptidoglycan/xylan/chitin deacetylase (PgdA/CDA1 family)
MTYPAPRPRATRRSFFDSPQVAAALVAVVLLLVAVLIVPGMLGPSSSPAPSGSAATGSGAPTASPTAGAPTFVRPTPSPNPTFTTYVVRSGDTLNSIATAFQTSARSIAWWNRGAYPSLDPESQDYEPNRLEIGWELSLIPGTVVDENNPPTPSPDPNATPALPPTSGPSGQPSAQPTAGPAAKAFFHGPRSVSNIALTFDMGGRLDPAVAIVQWLIDHGVHATLFPTGKSATQTVEGVAAMRLAATRPDLFDFANHSWDHPDFTDLTAAQMADQLTRTETALAPVFGSTKPWFRPPFGASSAAVRAGVGAAGWSSMVMWDVDTIDWRPEADGGPTAADMVAKVLANAEGGSIVLMHLGGYNTLEALPGLLSATATLGLQPVTLTKMLGS